MNFTFILLIVGLLDMQHVKPIPVGAYKTLEACQIAADKNNFEKKDELADPELAAKGVRFVCAELKGDA